MQKKVLVIGSVWPEPNSSAAGSRMMQLITCFLNMISYWLFFLSSVIMVISLFVEAGPAAAGWTIYPPLSALPQAIRNHI